MINNKGQTLVIFLLFIPIIIIVLASIFELGNITYEKKRIDSITKAIIIKDIDTLEKDDIINIYNMNDIKYEDVTVNKDNGLNITSNITIKSYLGSIIGKKEYHYNLNITGYKDNNEIKFKKG